MNQTELAAINRRLAATSPTQALAVLLDMLEQADGPPRIELLNNSPSPIDADGRADGGEIVVVSGDRVVTRHGGQSPDGLSCAIIVALAMRALRDFSAHAEGDEGTRPGADPVAWMNQEGLTVSNQMKRQMQAFNTDQEFTIPLCRITPVEGLVRSGASHHQEAQHAD